MRTIIFHADDLGLDPPANRGVAAVVATGLVREVSLVVTGPHAEDGAAVARDAGGRVGSGLHLSFTDGSAVAGPIDEITEGDGRFPSLFGLWTACAAMKPDPDAIRAEIEAQLDRLEALGVPADHVDGHHHVHAFPGIREALAEVVREREIPYVRVPREWPRAGPGHRLKRRFLARLSEGLVAALEEAGAEPLHLPFTGLSLYGARDYARRFEACLDGLPPGAVEWMVHPRADDPRLAPEFGHLRDPGLPARLEAAGIRIGRYSEVAES